VHISQPQQANGLWLKRDWLLAKEIVRKEHLVQRKRSNVASAGVLLKRKRWGTPCPQCREYDTDEVQSSSCTLCYGTGLVGGYFPGINFFITFDAPYTREFKRDETLSLTNNIVRTGRCVSYPFLDTNDVIARRDSGERLFVNKLETIAEVADVPVILKVELKLAPATDPVYQVPLTATSSSSSSSQSCNVQKGLHDGGMW
jgi:hypothetical protein